ncbi:MAG: aromatic ring-hydroxylating dioxygenase subunit alpha [Proteobacteria bacterium]|nr:MAG: aromatic ring-hydroxylating dioxygenase subunit alpha [Pseudomonadota bacterium]
MAYDYQHGCAVSPNAPEGSLEAKLSYVDNGCRRSDPERYYTPEFMQREADQLWSRTWLIACVESDIPASGDYSVFRLLREEFIIVRQPDGSVKAFFNVCAHRGNRLVHNDRGFVGQFNCTFHSWQYTLDGKLKAITDEETFRPEVVCHRPGLKSVRCETLAGLVFINLDPQAPPLTERIGLPPGYLEAYQIDKMNVVRHVVSEWAANWKTGIDAFYETYHLHAVHPETQGVMADLDVQFDLYPHGASRMIVPIGQKSSRIHDPAAMDPGLVYLMNAEGMDAAGFSGDARDVRRALAKHKRCRAVGLGFDYSHFTDGQLTDSWATGIFPNVQIGCHPEGVFLMRFLPHPSDPERFFYDTMTLFRGAEDPSYQAPGWMGLPDDTDLSGATRPDTEYVGVGEDADLGLVLEQDAALLPVLQRGIRSRAFDGPLWSEQEQRLRHFHTELDRYLAQEK